MDGVIYVLYMSMEADLYLTKMLRVGLRSGEGPDCITMMMIYRHVCSNGRLNGPNDLQR